MERQVDYLVIGSGFGGSVSAMRLAEKGYGVVVLEAGRRFRNEDFPETNWQAWKYLWAPLLGFTGFMRFRLPGHFMAMVGSGVGGGSLVYGAVLLDPPDEWYRDPQWAGLDPDWKKTLAPHFEFAKRMLGVARNPRLCRSDEVLREYAENIGRGHTFEPTQVGIFFRDPPGETVPDPYFDGEGPERTSCDFSGACIATGCRTGGKNSLDKNYLFFAEKYGARIVTETMATAIRPDGQGGYLVDTRRGTSVVPRDRKTWRAGNVVLAAGTLGTLELLLDCKRRNHLPHLSDHLGRHFRTNSEVLCGVTSRDADADFTEGVAIGSIMYPNDETSIECVRLNAGSDIMSAMGTVMTDGGTRLTRPLKWLWNCLKHPADALRMLIPFGRVKKSIYLLVMQKLDSSLRIVLRRSRLRPWKRVLRAEAPGGGVPSYIPEANECARAIAKKINGIPSSAVSEVLLSSPITAHLLGGCHMASDAEHGVVDKYGRVFGHEGLYVVDGALVPANLGVNPSLTIAALAEHAMSSIPPKKK